MIIGPHFYRHYLASNCPPEQLKIYQQCTARTPAPDKPQKEAWLICGRRGGKSFTLALIAVFLACFFDYKKYLAPGERGTIMVIASDKKQARVIMGYVAGLLENVPMLSRLIDKKLQEAIHLTNRISIEVQTASFRRVRGYTVVAALCDEIAFWRSEDSTNPDFEILDALRPAMATIPNAMLLCASSPYARVVRCGMRSRACMARMMLRPSSGKPLPGR